MIPEPSLIEYPSDFPIKVFGYSHQDFTQAVFDIMSRHDPEFKASCMETRNSKAAKYLSLTCTVRAVSRQQLDAIYQDLTDHPLVKMAL
jgi:putative lipoic acid-binding regulatory protein